MSLDKHPECGEDEVFVTNADHETWTKIGLKTKRRGMVAYKASGAVIEDHEWPGVFPVFAKKSEGDVVA